jgi:hypothetical protein
MKKIVLQTPDVQPSQVHKGWRDFTNNDEIQRLAVLDERIERQKRILSDTVKDRKSIRTRLIRRMRRYAGVE